MQGDFCIPGKGLRVVMVHAISKYGPFVTYRESVFSIKERWSEAKRYWGRSGADSSNISDEPTIEFLWRARLSCLNG